MRTRIKRPRRAAVLAALLGTLPALGLIQLPDAAKPYMGWSSWSLESATYSPDIDRIML